MRALRDNRGFTLLEVIVGSIMVIGSASFTVIMLMQMIRSSDTLLRRRALSQVEETVGRSVLERMLYYYREQTRTAASYCNIGQAIIPPPTMPTASNFAALFSGVYIPQNLDYELVTAANPPPIIGATAAPNYGGTVAANYMAARQRCLAGQTWQLTPNFANVTPFYFCVTIKPPKGAAGWWTASPGETGYAQAANTVLAEFSFQISNQKTGAQISCGNLVDYPCAVYPGSMSPMIATLYFDIHTVNRVNDVLTGSTDLRNVTYHHISSSIRSAPIVEPTTPILYEQLAAIDSGAGFSRNNRVPLPPVGAGQLWLPLASLPNCPGSQCRSRAQFFYLASSAPGYVPSGGNNVVVDFYMTNGTSPLSTLPPGSTHFHYPGADPQSPVTRGMAGWSLVGILSDCWSDIGCGGSVYLNQKMKTYGSLVPGVDKVLKGMYFSDPISMTTACDTPSLTDNPCCPKGFTYEGAFEDCSGTAPSPYLPSVACNAANKIAVCADLETF